jgi:hypothetical protein
MKEGLDVGRALPAMLFDNAWTRVLPLLRLASLSPCRPSLPSSNPLSPLSLPPLSLLLLFRMADQTERAFQKQLGVNIGFRKPVKKIPGKYGLRWYKNVGLGFKTPKEAIEG